MNLVIDIDDTLIKTPKYADGDTTIYEWQKATPIQDEIDLVNKHYDDGDRIILWTGRGWHHYNITKEQLEKFEIKHHELIMGKVEGIYIDADSKKSLRDL